jgi:hypothetical protein
MRVCHWEKPQGDAPEKRPATILQSYEQFYEPNEQKNKYMNINTI